MLKRTLVFLCTFYLVILFIYLNFFPISEYHNDSIEGENIIITGIVREIHYKNDKIQVYLKDVVFADGKISDRGMGAVAYFSQDTVCPQINEQVTLSGTFHNFERVTNPGQFDMARYYQLKGIDFSMAKCSIRGNKRTVTTVGALLYGIRRAAESVIGNNYSEENAAVLKAMLLGNKDELPEKIKDLFEKSGCSHVLCISGTHIGIIGMAIYVLFKKTIRNRKLSGIASAVIIIIYGMMTGMGAATCRAIIMFGINILSDITGRDYDLTTALSIAAVVSLVFNPLLIYDSGFLMSFGAVLGIGLVFPTVKFILPEIKKKNDDNGAAAAEKCFRKIYDGFRISISITIFTLPLALFFYYGISLYAVVINLIIIPLMGVLLASGILSVISGGLCLSFLAAVLSQITSAILWVYKLVCSIAVRLPGNYHILGKPHLWKIAAYYLILFIIIEITSYIKKSGYRKNIKIKSVILLLYLSALIFICCNIKTGFNLTVLDVGQGDCIIFSVKDKVFLMDCGSTDKEKAGKYILIPALKAMGVSHLEGIFISHGDADHVNGIEELISEGVKEGIEINRLFVTNNTYYSKEGEKIVNEARRNYPDAGIDIFEEGSRILVDGMQIEGLLPHRNERGDANEMSMVILIRYEKFSTLLCGDVEGNGEKALTDKLHEGVSVYKVAHHGSKGTSGESLLKKLRPLVAVVSAGKNNSYGHPHKETLKRLADIKSRVFVTIDSGAVSIKSDGRHIVIDCLKNE